jgi:hypothetical protein
MPRHTLSPRTPFPNWFRKLTPGKHPSKRRRNATASRSLLALEILEDRVAPAVFSDVAGVSITLTLTAGETVELAATGPNTYSLSTNKTFSGTLTGPSSFSPSLAGNPNSGSLTIDPLDGTLNIVDNGAGAHVIFIDSGNNAYLKNINVNLANGAAGNIDFDGASTFTQNLSATTTGRVNVNAGAVVSLNGGSNSLANSAAGGSVNFNGTLITSTSGTLSVSAFNSITESAATGAIKTNAATNATFRLTGGTGTINLGGANDFAGPVTITQTGGGSVTALVFRNANAAAALPTIGSLTGLTSYTLQLDNNPVPVNTVVLPGAVTTFNYLAGGDITQTAAFNFTGTATFTVLGNNNILLNSFANNIGTVGFNSLKADTTTQVSYRDSGAVNLGNSNLGLGTFNITSAGDLTQAGGTTVTQKIGAAGSTFTFTAGTATLTRAGNSFEGPITFAGTVTEVSLRNDSLTPQFPTLPTGLTDLTLNYGAAPISLPNLTALLPTLDNLTVTAQGIFQKPSTTFEGSTTIGSSTVTVSALAGLTVGQTVTGPGIQPGTTIVSIGTTTITLSLPATATASGVTLTAVNGVKVSTEASFNAGANPLVLDGVNDFMDVTDGGIQVNNSGPNQVVINDINSLNFGVGNSQLGNGTLTVTANGAITQANRVRQVANAGQTYFTTTPNNSINLDMDTNRFFGVVMLNTSGSGSATLFNGVNLNMGTSVIGAGVGGTGSLTLNGSAAVTQDPGTTLTVAGTTSLTGTNVVLDNNGNVFNGSVALDASNATVRDSTPFNFAASDVTGTLTIRSGGAITQSGAIIGNPTSLFDAGIAAITLTNTGNAFSDPISAISNGTGLSFTGTTTSGSSTITDVLSTAGLSVGQTITGPGTPANTTITAIGTTTITLSQNATATATGVTLTATSVVKLTAGGVLQVGRINLGTGPGVGSTALILTAGTNITQAAGTANGITQAPLVGASSFTMQQGGVGVNETQSLSFTATTGSFGIAFNGQVTTPLLVAATAVDIQAALEALPAIGAGNVLVTGVAGNYVVQFQGTLASTNVAPLTLVGAGNIVLNSNGTISLNNPNNSWSGLVDLTGANSVTGLALNNTNSLSFVGTPTMSGVVNLTAGQSTTLPNAAYSFTSFTASAKETYVSHNLTTTGGSGSNVLTFNGTANLAPRVPAPLTLASATTINFNGDVNVNTGGNTLTLAADTSVNLRQGTWRQGTNSLVINGGGVAFNIGTASLPQLPATFSMISGTINMAGAGNVTVNRLGTFQVGNTATAGTAETVTLNNGAGNLTFRNGSTLSVGLNQGGLANPNDLLLDSGGNVVLNSGVRLTAYSGRTDLSVPTPVLSTPAGIINTAAGFFDLTVDPAQGNTAHAFLMGTDIVTPDYLQTQLTIVAGGAVSATGTVTGFEPDSDKFTVTASTGATAELTTARNVNGLLDIVIRNALGAVTLTVTGTKNLGDGLTALGGIAVDGPGAATIVATNADVAADVLVEGPMTALTLRDVTGSTNYQTFIRAGGLNTQATTITGRRFNSVSISLPTVLTTLTLADYNGAGTNSIGIDTVTAERFGTIETTGVANTFVVGDFIVNRLTNLNTANSTLPGLGTVTIANQIQGQFDIQKAVTSVTSKRTGSAVSFTGNTNNGSPTISNVSTTAGLSVGQAITGAGIPAGTTLTAIGPTTITLSQNATGTSAGVELTASGVFSLGLPGAANSLNGDLLTTIGTLNLGTVTNSNIEAIGAVTSITATSWTRSANNVNNLNALCFGTITTTGHDTGDDTTDSTADDFGDFSFVNLTAIGCTAGPTGKTGKKRKAKAGKAPVGNALGSLSILGNASNNNLTITNGNVGAITVGRQITNWTVTAASTLTGGSMASLTAGAINGLNLDAKVVGSINAVGNEDAGLFGDLIGATGFNTITIHGMPNGAPVFTGVGLGVLKTARNLGASGTGQSVRLTIENGSLTTASVGYSITNSSILVLSNSGILGSLTAGEWIGSAPATADGLTGLVAFTVPTLTITGAPLALPSSPLLIGDLRSVNIVAFAGNSLPPIVSTTLPPVVSTTTPSIGAFSVAGNVVFGASGFLRADNGITSFKVGRDVTASSASTSILISVRNATLGAIGSISVGRWDDAVASVDLVADTIGTMTVTGYRIRENPTPSKVLGDFLATNFVMLNNTLVDVTSVTVANSQNVSNFVAPGGIGTLTVADQLLGSVDTDNPKGTLGNITTLQAGQLGVFGTSAATAIPATIRAVTIGTLKTVINIPLGADGSVNGSTVTATTSTALTGITTVTIASFMTGNFDGDTSTFNVPRSITTFTVTEDVNSGSEIGVGYAADSSLKTFTAGAIDSSVLTSRSISALNVVGKSPKVRTARVLAADVVDSVITAIGNIGGVGLGAVTIAQKVIDSDFNVAAGNVTSFTVGGMFGSHLTVGAHPAARGNILAPATASNWNGPPNPIGVTFELGSFKTTGVFDPVDVLHTASFRDSFIIAQQLGSVAIVGLDQNTPAGSAAVAFGVAFRGSAGPGPSITVTFSDGGGLTTQILAAPASFVTTTPPSAFNYVNLGG